MTRETKIQTILLIPFILSIAYGFLQTIDDKPYYRKVWITQIGIDGSPRNVVAYWDGATLSEYPPLAYPYRKDR